MGWFGDLVNLGKDAVKTEAQRRIADAQTRGTAVDVVPIQNKVVEEFGEILDAYKAGRISREVAYQRIYNANLGYTDFCRTVGTQRALNGAADVNTLATQIMRDLQAAASPAGVPGLPQFPGFPGAGGVPTGGVGSLSITTVVLGAGLVYLLARR